MNANQLANIPSGLLFERGTKRLRVWLADRGLLLSLLDLAQERERRLTGSPATQRAIR